jgi:dienelactone hydrolase
VYVEDSKGATDKAIEPKDIFEIAFREECFHMKYFIYVLLLLSVSTLAFGASGAPVTYQVNGLSYEGYYISPSKQAPFLLLIHDWDGLTDYEVKRAQMLADLGYAVFALDLFGAGVRPTEMQDKRQHTGELYKNREKMRALMKGALDAAGKKGANIDNAVAFGYCFGGAAVLELARSGADLKGFATFHGGLQTPEGQNYSKARGKFLIMHGSADTAITLDQFAELAKELESAGIDHEMITYGGAQHAFTVFGGDRYQEAADKKSWKRFTEFLAETLKN